MTHYNDPDLSCTAFLYACMRDRELPLPDHIKAAGALMELEPDGPPKPSLVIKITLPWQLIEDMQEQWEAFSAEQHEYFLTLPPEGIHGCGQSPDAMQRAGHRSPPGAHGNQGPWMKVVHR